MEDPDRRFATTMTSLFDGFEAEVARRVAVPGADAARRAAYHRGRRNAHALTALTAITALGVGSGVTYALTGGGGTPSGITPPGGASAPAQTPVPFASAPDLLGRTGPPKGELEKVNLTVTAQPEVRLSKAKQGGYHGTVTFTVRNDGPSPVSRMILNYDLTPQLEFESGVESSGVARCVIAGTAGAWKCHPTSPIAVGASVTYEVKVYTGLAASAAAQVIQTTFGAVPHPNAGHNYEEQSEGNNTASVRVIVPAA